MTSNANLQPNESTSNAQFQPDITTFRGKIEFFASKKLQKNSATENERCSLAKSFIFTNKTVKLP